MNGFVYNIPPQTVEECLEPELQGLLEIEVSHLSFISTSSTSSLSPPLSSDNGKFSCCSVAKDAIKKNSEFFLESKINNTSCLNVDLNHNFQSVNKQNQERYPLNINNTFCPPNTSFVHVKIVWFGERKEDAANLCISCDSQQHPTLDYTILRKNRKKPKHLRKPKHKRLQLQPPISVKSANNTLRYRISTTKALLLDYLSSCKPIQVIVTSSGSNSHCLSEPLGQAQFRLPQVLLKKFAFNIGKGHNFEHKTKIYTLYQTNNRPRCKDLLADNNLLLPGAKQKAGEIQLRFRMLFAPSAAVTAVTAASTASLATKHHTNNVLHDKKLTSSSLQHHHNNRHHAHMGNHIVGKVAEHVQGDKSQRFSSQAKAEEIVEAMKKLDAKLVAYLAGEAEITSKHPNNCEEENEVNLNLETNHLNNKNNNMNSCGDITAAHLDDLSPATKLNTFKYIKGIKLEMEALTLQSEGTKYMNLMQNEIRPIFTVECQLSNELIKKVPRYDMFHIMQFESEKFHSLTQCTRFSQQAERKVQLDVDENGNADEMNLGRIYLTVWWREPGTCLNEMLGMGVLELRDLFNASLLEQCKRIDIKRRGIHLACLYFKIILQRDTKLKLPLSSSLSSNLQMKREIFVPKQSSCDSGDEKSPQKTTDKQTAPTDAHEQQQQQQLTGNISANDKTSTEKASSSAQKNTKLQTTNFDDETTKVRLLKGLIYANEARFFEEEPTNQHKQMFLICRRFWLEEPAATKADECNKFNYQEQFSVINDDKFLQRVDKQFLNLELWQQIAVDDGNGNDNYKIHPMGLVNIPLHQFYIAYRDAAITNHLCKGKLPVISIDAWAPIINCESGEKIGELKCLFAVGTEEQIKNLKDCRGLAGELYTKDCADLLLKGELQHLKPLQVPTTKKDEKCSSTNNNNNNNKPNVSRAKRASDILDMLQKLLMTPVPATARAASTSDGVIGTSSKPLYQSSANEDPVAGTSALKPLQPSNIKLFKFTLEIQRALGLPLHPPTKTKNPSKQRYWSKRFPPNEAPSTYVTFQAEEGPYQTYKSHEGKVFTTSIIEKSTHPQWFQRFRLAINVDYLTNHQRRFILKVWKKSAVDMVEGRNQPSPMEDVILGFAALDLTVFMRGLHIGGRFNIVDFNGRINGQLEVRCQPIEDNPATNSIAPPPTTGSNDSTMVPMSSVDSVIDQFEQTLDVTHLNLGQAIKRKFTELEGISQRLRARLGDITGTEMSQVVNMEQFDNWQPLEKEIGPDNDVFDEFEHDLNTPHEEESEQANKEKQKPPQGNCEIDAVPKSE